MMIVTKILKNRKPVAQCFWTLNMITQITENEKMHTITDLYLGDVLVFFLIPVA